MKIRLACLLVIVLNLILSSSENAGAKKLRFKTCAKPLPLQLKPFTNQPQQIDYLCGNTGCFKNAANNEQNAQKNNLCAATEAITPVTLKTFSDLNNASNNESSIPKGEPPASRTQLANIVKLPQGKPWAKVRWFLSSVMCSMRGTQTSIRTIR